MADLDRQSLHGKLVKMLRGHPILEGMSDSQIEELAGRAKFEPRKAGETIIHQGAAGDTFYFIIDGQVRVIDTSRQPPLLLAYLQNNQFFGERALLFNTPRDATVDVVVDTQLAAFDRSAWNWLIGNLPGLSEKLTEVKAYYDEQARFDFPGRHLDEVVIRKDNRHILAFIAKLPGPLILIVLGLAVEILVLNLGFSTFGIFSILAILFIVMGILWMIYTYVDWLNDDFIITSDRVVHIERNIIYGQQREEAPLPQIQDVTTDIPNLFAQFFDYSDLTIKTAGAGDIRFDGLPQADKIKAAIFEQRTQALRRVEASDTAAIRKSLVERMSWDVGPIEPSTLIATTPVSAKQKLKLPRFLNYLIPKPREEKAGTIIWRKHYLVLLKYITSPIIIALVCFYFLLDALFGLRFFLLPQPSIVWPLLILEIFIFIWYLYAYDTWYKDVYIVTPVSIIDIEGSAFNLRGEKRRQGMFDVIQNTTVNIPNLLAQWLNMGDVVIQTAGTIGTFTFKQVYNPRDVQQEIFNRWVAHKENERRKARTAEEKRYTRWLGEYHELARIAAQKSREP